MTLSFQPIDPAQKASWLVYWVLLLGLPAVLWTTAAIAVDTNETSEVEQKLVQVDEQIFLGIVPSPIEHFEGLVDFALVIDLRYPYEGVYDDVGVLRTLGIQQINLPTSSRNPSQEVVDAIAQQLGDHPGERILIHDSSGYRTAMTWAAYRVSLGMDPRKALAEVQALGDYPALQVTIERYAQSISSSH